MTDRSTASRATARPSTDKKCFGADAATLGVVFKAVFDSFTPSLPENYRPAARAAGKQVLAAMHSMTISSLAISMHPAQLGASPAAPMNKYRDPLSQWIVTQLMNVKNGEAAQPIRVDNLTLSQAVETAWLYFYVTAVIPLTLLKSTMPSIYSLGPVGVGTLITLPISVGTAGMSLLYKAIGNAIIDQCIARSSDEEIANAGKPDPDLRFTAQVPTIIQETADQVSIAEPDTCPAIADLSIGRIAERTADYLKAIAPNDATRRQIAQKYRELRHFMKTTRVPAGLIPADPADFNGIEAVLSIGMGLVPYAGGALTDILIGLGHNIGQGDNLGATVPLADLTVTKTLTAAYYSYALTTQFVSVLNSLAADSLATTLGGINILPNIGGVIDAPNTYGLVVYHNALRSLCLTEDYRPKADSATPVAKW
ncbi:hypothetical protein [Gordonia sp. MP11Mi]|uniref:Uncharacterized protein n=1 Tax=Gordonia sp. MP11Mi TaxID=3022769 RepID=A0AA97CW46_9ACTN